MKIKKMYRILIIIALFFSQVSWATGPLPIEELEEARVTVATSLIREHARGLKKPLDISSSVKCFNRMIPEHPELVGAECTVVVDAPLREVLFLFLSFDNELLKVDTIKQMKLNRVLIPETLYDVLFHLDAPVWDVSADSYFLVDRSETGKVIVQWIQRGEGDGINSANGAITFFDLPGEKTLANIYAFDHSKRVTNFASRMVARSFAKRHYGNYGRAFQKYFRANRLTQR